MLTPSLSNSAWLKNQLFLNNTHFYDSDGQQQLMPDRLLFEFNYVL